MLRRMSLSRSTASTGSRSVRIHIGLPIAILVSVGLHLTLAICVLIRPENSELLILSGLDRLIEGTGSSSGAFAVSLIVLSLFALVGVALENRIDMRLCTVLVLPQYAIMLLALFTSISVVIDGENPNTGQPVDRSLAITALAPVSWVAIGHTVAFWERYVSRWR